MTLQRYLTRVIAWCVAPLLLLAVWLGVSGVRETGDHHQREAQNIARLVASAIDQTLSARVCGLQMLAVSLSPRDPIGWSASQDEADAFSLVFDSPTSVIDREGRRQLRSGLLAGSAPPPPAPAARAAATQAMQTGRPATSDLFVGTITAAPTLIVAVPVPVKGGAQAELAVTSGLPAASLQALLAQASLPASWSLTLKDSQGTVIARRGPTAAAADIGFSHRETLALAPWTLELDIEHEAWMAPLRRTAWALGLAVLGLTLVGVLAAAAGAHRLARAVHSLAEAGSPGPPHDGPAIDEFDTVRRRLDALAAAREQAETEARTNAERLRDHMEREAVSLRFNQARLRGIFESSSDAILTTDEAQTIVMANDAASRMLGHPLSALLGMPLERVVPARRREHHRQQLARLGADGDDGRSIRHGAGMYALRADGNEIPVDAAISFARVEHQRLYTVAMRDISERVQAEEALRASKAKLDAALASIGDAVFISDLDGRFVEFNEAFATFHRFPNKAQCLKTLAEYPALLEVRMPDGTVAPLSQWVVPRALRGESGSSVEYRLRRRDTGESWVGSYSFGPIRNPHGEIVGAVATARDVTELHHVRAELETSQLALRRLLAARDNVQERERIRIARELHDELQQTLAAIKMDVAAVAVDLRSEPARVPPLLARIDELATAAIVSTRRIVNDLRPQMLEELGLLPALEALALQFSQRTGIECHVRTDGERAAQEAQLPPSLTTCLYRIAQESLNNVAKHAHARRVSIELDDGPAATVRLRIADDGRGLSEADRRKPRSFGLLGMRERVRALGGTLDIRSASGAGTTLVVCLPVALEATDSGSMPLL